MTELEHRNRSMLRGALLGGGLALLFFLPVAWGPLVGEGPGDPEFLAVALAFFLAPFVAGILAGAVLGYCSERFETYRYVKLLGVALGLYFAAAYLSALVLLIITETVEPGGVPDGMIYGVLYLGTAGALMFGLVLVPAIAIVVFVLERWTRRKAEVAA